MKRRTEEEYQERIEYLERVILEGTQVFKEMKKLGYDMNQLKKNVESYLGEVSKVDKERKTRTKWQNSKLGNQSY